MASCCCWVLNCWWLDWPLVCRCLLGMAGMKPIRRRLTARQNIRNDRLLHRGSQVLLCSQLLHRGSSLSHHQRSKTNITAEVLIFPELHNPNWGGQVLRSLNFLHNRCPFVLRWTEILHWSPSSILHHNLRYTLLLHGSSEVLLCPELLHR
jgi:hypothetical protein